MPKLELTDEQSKFIDEADGGAKDEIAAALSAAKKLRIIATIGLGQHHDYVDPFTIAERKGLSLVLDFVQPREQRAAIEGIAGIALAHQSHRHEPSGEPPAVDHALRKALSHAIFALDALPKGGQIEGDAQAAHDFATPSVFADKVVDNLAGHIVDLTAGKDEIEGEHATGDAATETADVRKSEVEEFGDHHERENRSEPRGEGVIPQGSPVVPLASERVAKVEGADDRGERDEREHATELAAADPAPENREVIPPEYLEHPPVTDVAAPETIATGNAVVPERPVVDADEA